MKKFISFFVKSLLLCSVILIASANHVKAQVDSDDEEEAILPPPTSTGTAPVIIDDSDSNDASEVDYED